VTDAEFHLVIAKIDDAIRALQIYQTNEPDGAKRNAAGTKIQELRDQKVDAHWQQITDRDQALRALMDELRQITRQASNVQTISGALNQLNGVIGDIATIVNPGGGNAG
jgi:hypothetical protein